jgi:hypothetical protein
MSDDDFRNTIQMLATEGPSLVTRVSKLEQEVEEVAEKLNGKDDATPGLVPRMAQLEVRVSSVKRNVARTPGELPHDDDDDDTNTKVEALQTQLNHLIVVVEDIEKVLDSFPQTVAADVDTKVEKIQLILDSLRDDLGHQQTSIDKIRPEVEAQVTDLRRTVINNFQSKKASSDAFKQMETDIMNEVDQKLKPMNDQLRTMKRHSTQSPVLPINQLPQQPQLPRQSPHLANGRTPSPLVNGSVGPPQHVHGYNANSAMVQLPIPQQQQQTQSLLNESQNLHQRLDQVTLILNQLKLRYDNLTTDEMVKLMMKQFEAVWPHAAKYEAANNQVWKALQDINKWLGTMQNNIEDLQNAQSSSAVQQALTNLGNVTKMIEEVRKMSASNERLLGGVDANNMNEMIMKIGPELAEVKKLATNLSTETGKMKGGLNSIIDRMAMVEGRVDGMEVVLNNDE